MLWKPSLLSRELARHDMDEGDVALNHDVHLRSYPDDRQHVREWRSMSFATSMILALISLRLWVCRWGWMIHPRPLRDGPIYRTVIETDPP